MKINSEKGKLQMESRPSDQSQRAPAVMDFFLIDQIAGKLRDQGKTAAEASSTLRELGFSAQQIKRALHNQYDLE